MASVAIIHGMKISCQVVEFSFPFSLAIKILHFRKTRNLLATKIKFIRRIMLLKSVTERKLWNISSIYCLLCLPPLLLSMESGAETFRFLSCLYHFSLLIQTLICYCFVKEKKKCRKTVLRGKIKCKTSENEKTLKQHMLLTFCSSD